MTNISTCYHYVTISLVESPCGAAHVILKAVLWYKYLWNVKGIVLFSQKNKVTNESRSVQLLVATPKCDVIT